MITKTTTTMLKILFIVPCMGIYVLTTHRRTPAAIITSKMVKSDIKNVVKV
jgi:hypothetical protein